MKNKPKDPNGFVTECETSKVLPGVLGVVFSAFTFFIGFFLFYEQFFERFYWINRWKLYKYLRQKKVRLISRNIIDLSIQELIVDINNVEYQVWIYVDENKMTFDSPNFETFDSQSFIGLFCASPFMVLVNNRTIKMLQKLEVSEINKEEN
jgi:hypothetical protein